MAVPLMLRTPAAPYARPDELDGALDRLESAREPWVSLSHADATILLAARDEDLDRLLLVAGRIRDDGLAAAGRPGVITYSRKVFIPLTHLCQDRCHYCIFVQTPGKLTKAGISPYMEPEEVLEVARQGAALGCKEALLTLGDRPENRWPIARQWLDEHGYESTLDYVKAMAELILAETGLLPHLNPGVMSWAELQRLKPVGPSMGMMLETTSSRIWETPGEAHFGSPDKDPAVRLRVIDDAGRSRIPFTTGVLLGIGETAADRIDAVLALRASHEKHGHIQEVIVQNFRAKNATAMMGAVDLETQEYAAAVAVTRVLLGPGMRVQAPPNLTDAGELALLVRAGIDDWGGVSPLTPDHVNPERPWPQIEELARLTAEGGYTLRERLTAHPHYLREARGAVAAGGDAGRGADWFDDRLSPRLLELADDYGLAKHDAYLESVLKRAEADPTGLTDAEYVALLHADGDDLETLAALADRVRHERVGDTVTYAINRNLDASLGLPASDIAALADEAAALGATEICAQGAVPRELGADGYLDFARAIKRAQPGLHLHAFRPAEVLDGAARAGLALAGWLERLRAAGVDTVPGTGARILDDRIRGILTGGTDIPASVWLDTVENAHRAGLRSTATMIYGHVETAADQVKHLRTLAALQDRTGGFTELIAMPWLPSESPVDVPGARPGPSLRESRAVHAVARLMLAGRIDHIQAAWTKLGLRGAQLVLAGGADDLGGVLLDGVVDPSAGPEQGRQLTVADVTRLAAELGRPVRQRTTTYGEVRSDG
ncbi:7,8-didemethyl-8-hydroxy-5-deazariboflavin synthase CofG [Gryllotalpicola protaetiae]|uniref:7,8-didemethyl-8-hydroxy-5-deazariboflavin synthase n=1 Tax=Gryllotalpicola protaetiae TaxID=2419771 RepID=A0A387BH01_9MICO|nr:7,8-didemethyl-8-hydroxy-5-deazariboflavin synthase CofG [Gryllotalpicola protaetiae]AYG03285.1 7,8-didemethyl-8-hydroxy-5-deazariboflavin synthase subunit CofG [Gryllotalpicola protaetiae]